MSWIYSKHHLYVMDNCTTKVYHRSIRKCSESFQEIIHLSRIQPTEQKFKLLPIPRKIQQSNFARYWRIYTSYKLKAHFNNENEPNDGRRKDSYIKNKSTWTPHNPHHTIKKFFEALINEIKSLPGTYIDTRKNNLTKDETKSLNNLSPNLCVSYFYILYSKGALPFHAVQLLVFVNL